MSQKLTTDDDSPVDAATPSTHSLDEPEQTHSKIVTVLQKTKSMLKYVGPGFLIAVGYVDPGNWATDLVAGSKYNYTLLCVIFLSNIMAVVLQDLCARLGIVTGKDLAQHCRQEFSFTVSTILYVLAECAMIATDISEVIGTALAIQLLFRIPLTVGVLLTGFNALFVLLFWGSKTIKFFEIATVVLVAAVGACFTSLLAAIEPDWVQVALGCLPTLKIIGNTDMLYIAIGILGATIMPHNLYLHSYLVQFHRKQPPVSLDNSKNACDKQVNFIWMQIRYSFYDLVFALTVALAINGAILVLAAAAFYKRGLHDIADLYDAHALLSEFIGPIWGGGLFAVALFLASNSSTITGTLTGQIVMEGFWDWKLSPFWRRVITRLVAMLPALVVSILTGESGVTELLIATQAVLSIQLPFAAWPLVYFTCSKRIMKYNPNSYSQPKLSAALSTSDSHIEELQNSLVRSSTASLLEKDSVDGSYAWVDAVDFANGTWLKVASIVLTTIITLLNIILLVQIVLDV